MRTANINIDPKALNHNINQIAKLTNASSAKIMVMLKANAYGHGIDVCTLGMLKNENVQAIGLATMEEALFVRSLGWERSIVLIEGVFSQQEWQTAILHEMQCVIHHKQQLEWALKTLPNDTSPTRTIWLKLNTGMNRLGFNAEEITTIASQLDEAGYRQILTSHFANADDKDHPLNANQGLLFSQKLNELKQQVNPDIEGSLCNSAGIVNFPDWHYDWVRAGIMMYGSSPVIDQTANELNLQPVMTLSTKIMAIHDIDKGEMVGYGSRWIAEKPSRIAIISIGYGDGYPRVVDDTAFVSVIINSSVVDNANTDDDIQSENHSINCPIIGRVAMDMMVIDISHVNHANNTSDITIDDHVIMWGKSPHIDQIATSANTIGYELLCRITTRPNRQLLSC